MKHRTYRRKLLEMNALAVRAKRMKAHAARGDLNTLTFKLVGLGNRKFALVDNKDFPLIQQSIWRESSNGYAIRDQRPRRMHRQIMERALGRPLRAEETVDHINRNKLDNRRTNLRIASKQQNCFNQRPRLGTSKFKGVYWSNQKQRWVASINPSGKRVHCGSSESEIEAAYLYDQFALQLFGEFAVLNVVDA